MSQKECSEKTTPEKENGLNATVFEGCLVIPFLQESRI